MSQNASDCRDVYSKYARAEGHNLRYVKRFGGQSRGRAKKRCILHHGTRSATIGAGRKPLGIARDRETHKKNPAPSPRHSVMNFTAAPRLKGAGQCHHSRSFEDAGRSCVFAGNVGATHAPLSRLLYSAGYPTYGYCPSGDNRNIVSAIKKNKGQMRSGIGKSTRRRQGRAPVPGVETPLNVDYRWTPAGT